MTAEQLPGSQLASALGVLMETSRPFFPRERSGERLGDLGVSVSFSLTHTHTWSLSLSLSLSHTHTHTKSLSHTHTRVEEDVHTTSIHHDDSCTLEQLGADNRGQSSMTLGSTGGMKL